MQKADELQSARTNKVGTELGVKMKIQNLSQIKTKNYKMICFYFSIA